MTSRMRWRPCAMQPRSATALGESELLARAALAYEQVAWRAGLPGDPPAAYLLQRAMRHLPEGHAPLLAQLAGALARAFVYAGAADGGTGTGYPGDRHGAPTW